MKSRYLLKGSVIGVLVLVLVGYLVSVSNTQAATNHPKNRVEYYVETYGMVTPQQDSQVARAHQVFERVLTVADKNSKRLPKLVVVNSPGDPWAIALPTGQIILSARAVNIAHKQATREESEARLAFVLGHELAHLANDDFWHQEIYSFLNRQSGNSRIAGLPPGREQLNERELAADDKGYVYAAMAGYPVELLLKPHSEASNFFEFWLQQTSARGQSSYPNEKARTALLRKRLHDVQNRLGFFNFGVRLGHFGYCDDAVYFLREFQQVFPGREVLNNLGYCYLQMARNEMDGNRAYFYWMPTLLDAETRAAAFVSRSEDSPKNLRQAAFAKGTGFLEEAVEYLRRASESDPGYLPAKLNLVAAFLYLGKPHQARAVLAEARLLAPHDPIVQSMDSVALYEQSDSELDLWPSAVAKLEKQAAKPDVPAAILYNLARLLDLRPRPLEARSYWNRLAQLDLRLPGPIRSMVCRKQSQLPQQICMKVSSKNSSPSPWKWPLRIKGLEQLSARTKQARLSGWDSIEFDWFKDKLHGHIYVHPDRTKEVLEMNLFVQMQVLNGSEIGTVHDLPNYCAYPLRQRHLAQGVVWTCGDWAALTLNDKIQQVWWVAK